MSTKKNGLHFESGAIGESVTCTFVHADFSDMAECTNHRPWNTKTPSHKISHNKHYGKQSTIDNETSISRVVAFIHLAYTNYDKFLQNSVQKSRFANYKGRIQTGSHSPQNFNIIKTICVSSLLKSKFYYVSVKGANKLNPSPPARAKIKRLNSNQNRVGL